MNRFHKKRDGLYFIKPDGTARFLTRWESLLYRLFGKEPQAAPTPPATPGRSK